MPNWLTDPLTEAPSRLASKLANKIDDPMAADRSPLRGFAAGALEGAGGLVSDMTSPLGLALSAIGPSAAGLKGLLSGAKGLKKAAPAMNQMKQFGPGAKRMSEFGPEAYTISDEMAAMEAMRRANKQFEALRLQEIARKGGVGPNFGSVPGGDELAAMMAKRRAMVPDPPRSGMPVPNQAAANVPVGPSENVMPRVMSSMNRQDKINAARKKSQRARNFRSNTPED